MRGFNFTRTPGTISATVERLLATAGRRERAEAVLESMIAAEFMPQFRRRIRCRYSTEVRATHMDRNRVKVQTHYDLLYNIACVVAGAGASRCFRPGRSQICTRARSTSRPRHARSAWCR